MEMTYAEWLHQLKAGAQVVIGDTLREVTRTTPTIIYVGDAAYNRDSGRRRGSSRYGGGYHSMQPLKQPTEEALQRVRKASLMRWAIYEANNDIKRLSLDGIEKVRSLVRQIAQQDAADKAKAEEVVRP